MCKGRIPGAATPGKRVLEGLGKLSETSPEVQPGQIGSWVVSNRKFLGYAFRQGAL